MKKYHLSFLILVLGIGFLSGEERSEKRPNLILILADDMGFSDISSYGSEIQTPSIDALAEQGLRFSHFYNNAVCVPTRASLLTGMYPHQVGRALRAEPGWPASGVALRSQDESLPPPEGHYRASAYGQGEPGTPGGLSLNHLTLAELLKQAGYQTYMSGKWHCGEAEENWPVNRGFDRYFGLLHGSANYFNLEKDYLSTRQMMLDDQFYDPPEEGFYMTDAISDYAVRFVEEAEGDEAPFFMYVAYTAPHFPLQAWPEDIAREADYFSAGWDHLRMKRYERLQRMGVLGSETELTPRDHAVTSWRIKEIVGESPKLERKMEVYAAMIKRMDYGIGRISRALEATGAKENTLILFLSDNGPYAGYLDSDRGSLDSSLPPGGENAYESRGIGWANLSSTPFRLYKQWLHEGGIATPLIASWPAVIPDEGGIRHEVGHVMDFFPTFYELSGSSAEGETETAPLQKVEGESLVPLLKGGDRPGYEILCWENEGHRAIRKGKWKLVAKYRTWELYDMSIDRAELRNVAAAYPEVVEELAWEYDRWARRVGAGVPGIARDSREDG